MLLYQIFHLHSSKMMRHKTIKLVYLRLTFFAQNFNNKLILLTDNSTKNAL